MDEPTFSDDIRIQELESCQTIYPNLRISKLSGSIDIPIKLDTESEIRLIQNSTVLASKQVVNLPAITLDFTLPEGYPYDHPPQIKLSSQIIHPDKLNKLETELSSVWFDYKDQVIFMLIDKLLDTTQNNIDEILPSPIEIIDHYQLYYDIIDYDQSTKQAEFNNSTFACEICQNNYSGLQCSKFDCGHVFCNDCLYEYFSSVITTGEIDKVHCPDFECTKLHIKTRDSFAKLETWMENDSKVKEMVTTMLTPTVPLALLTHIFKPKTDQANELVKRYMTLYKKSQFEFIGKLLPNRLVSCPRIGCDEVIFREDLHERLVRCPKCQYSFCNDCRMSYHTRFKLCNKVNENENYSGIPVADLEAYPLYPSDSYERKTLNARYGRITILRAIEEYKMDKLFEAMLKEGNQARECPGCKTVIEKSEGCNRMKCSECSTFFCFNCGNQISRNYDHYSDTTSPCYRLLFFGMLGAEQDDDDDDEFID
ncbi:uncharacterized protein SPAPADRAFT_141135 [Spathaspora passalidarum NRRL Y-27907]|uniref:RBR-type E3 ubiquitin transferase n=1 Tax=Spathaspora passalidarum (strain NRRL Y-27907 / 11-Y1) TaxID=619300 RepID=G3AQP1_SPAPN|nr:uncharacterized protein SPAPADRAFT_141135 [Spathaspora passalidarum NRRL Y-27907]EGW31588.1 hypothetical protein SPAPADRAFT_141135 [Spathaspora passalidarum NRRL Y-27907]